MSDGEDFDPVIPLLDGQTPPEDVAVEGVPEKDSYAVPRPVVGDTHVESITVSLKDGRVVRFSEPDGALDESRIFPDVIEFCEREVYDLAGSDDDE
jgi:hypothetical protein